MKRPALEGAGKNVRLASAHYTLEEGDRVLWVPTKDGSARLLVVNPEREALVIHPDGAREVYRPGRAAA